jgi:hypothetical protein
LRQILTALACRAYRRAVRTEDAPLLDLPDGRKVADFDAGIEGRSNIPRLAGVSVSSGGTAVAGCGFRFVA